MELRDGMETMSLDGTSHGVPLRGLDAHGLRTVIYVDIFPNILLSLHPDYVMTHRMVPVAADRTLVECTWAFAPEAVARADFDPGYAVEFWDITNRQDWAACESVQRGLASPHALARAAGAGRGRGVLLRHHDRAGLPRPAGVGCGSGSVVGVTVLDIPVKTLAGQDSSLASLDGQDAAGGERGLQVRAHAAVHRAGEAAGAIRVPAASRSSGSRATSSAGRSRARRRRSRSSARRPTGSASRCSRRSR